jgi:DNA-binding LytR/AlgR family response regulator
MERKLRCIVIDDDSEIHTLISGFLKESDKAVVKKSFENCSDFLRQMNDMSFDLVFLDCFFPYDTKDGVDVAIKLKELGKHFIFISAKNRSFVNACRAVGALDAMPKPLTEKRFEQGINTAYEVIIQSRTRQRRNALFHVKEQKGELNINLPDILYVRTDSTDPRNKIVRMKNNINYTFMDCRFDDLLELSSDFAMVNKSELISYAIVEVINGEWIVLRQNENNNIPRSIALSPVYRYDFKYELH